MFSKINEFVFYIVFESFPCTEYIVEALLNWELTQKLINNSRNGSRLEERLISFIIVTIRSFLYIFITSIIFVKIIESIAVDLFKDYNLPTWSCPFFIFVAWKSFNEIFDDFS